jgi:hypothetical protein
MSKILAGPFAARRLGGRSWLLATDAPAGPEVYLQGIDPGAAQFMSGTSIAELALVWRGDGVEITMTTATGVRALRAATALVHEPKPRLYESLPLVGFDSAARRFWNRVFWLMRIPGGRYLLGFIARGNRGIRSAAKK